MEEVSFNCTGHKNILGTHKNTFEFTKDNFLTLQGDCIIGINADFNALQIKEISRWNKVFIKIKCADMIETANGIPNPNFDDEREIVARKSDFKSKRTLILFCDKGAKDFKRDFIDKLKDINSKINITFSDYST